MNVTHEHPEVRRILQAIIEDTRAGVPILLDHRERYGTTLGDFRVQFEGEDDLLHLSIMRVDGEPICHEEAQRIAEAFFHSVPKGLIQCRPAVYSVHYYIAHDLLVDYWEGNSHHGELRLPAE
ncbi:MAG: hypothetical protein HPY54_07370 [Chthonomonadetes bacterium]|jgi:hypothetical protein|nr:hypothetical protein [Chthonomonadetes bacterium]